jgi:hypothetical protein
MFMIKSWIINCKYYIALNEICDYRKRKERGGKAMGVYFKLSPSESSAVIK